jgi:ATP-dependent Lon protease
MPNIERDGETLEIPSSLPLLPLRDLVIFPYMITPLLVGRKASINALQDAMVNDRILLVAAQIRPDTSRPRREDLHDVGTVVKIIQLVRLPEGTLKILVEGMARVNLGRYVQEKEFFRCLVEPVEEGMPDSSEIEALVRSINNLFREYVGLNKRLPQEVLMSVVSIESPGRLADTIAAHLSARMEAKQEILGTISLVERLRVLHRVLSQEIEILQLERKIEGEVKTQVQRNQKEFYLHEQMKAIRKELGQQADDLYELDELREEVEKAGMPEEVKAIALKELDRMSRMPPMSPEATVVRNYVDTLVALPWKTRSEDNLDIQEVRKKLDADHYGLEKVKERILEYLAVVKLVGKLKGPILCFVGPPGVGKTSLGNSIADALGRKFVRLSLGGVRDEAEIRGHRRTYIGSMPGRIIQSMKRAGTVNPVILMDEVDKLSSDFRGDPASALLEVLDPEQNSTFSDHYLEVEYNLSEVMFITTANVVYSIPPALQDRLEIIRLPGYMEFEKVAIAEGFLMPKLFKEHGLETGRLKISSATLRAIINNYTAEAGVRNLERELARICRKAARKIAENPKVKTIRVYPRNLESYLGVPKVPEKKIEEKTGVGVATGLAWTRTGGEILDIEVTFMPGKGNVQLTGQLGEVMQESARAALSVARDKARGLPLKTDFFSEIDVHIHVPEGAIPKDGPSAGIAICTALVSAFYRIPVKRDVAMTGELTLRGKALPIGGIDEKCMAALRAGVKTVLLPRKNEPNLKEVPQVIKDKLQFVFVDTMDDVLEHALVEPILETGGGKDVEPRSFFDETGPRAH